MIDLIKGYIDKRIQLIKLELISILANVSAGLVNVLIILLISLFIMVMFSLALGFFVSELLGSNALGFAVIGGVYTLIFVIYLSLSKTKIDNLIKDKVVQLALSEDDSEEKDNHEE